MKRICIGLAVAIMVFAMAGCGGGSSYDGKTEDVKLNGLVTVKVPEELKPSVTNGFDGKPSQISIAKGEALITILIGNNADYTTEGTWESVKKLDMDVYGKKAKEYEHSLGDAYIVEKESATSIHIKLNDSKYVSIYATGEGFKDVLNDKLVKYTIDNISK